MSTPLISTNTNKHTHVLFLTRPHPRNCRGVDDGIWWAAITITTIGYGDAANPNNVEERGVALLCMTVGASVWAYTLSCGCNLI